MSSRSPNDRTERMFSDQIADRSPDSDHSDRSAQRLAVIAVGLGIVIIVFTIAGVLRIVG